MGQAASELQHVANQLQGMGPEEKRFIEAVFEGKVAEAQAALQENPNVIFARTKDWYNAWHLAARAGNMEMLQMLSSFGKGTRKPIPGEPQPYSAKSKKGQTPLMLACEEGNAEAMQLLLAIGANVLDIDTYGNTAVHYAAFKGHTKALEMLLGRSDADGRGDKAKRFTDLRNEAGLMPLHLAVWGGHRGTASALVAAKCRLNSTSHSHSLGLVTCNAGSTALHLAAMKGNVQMVRFLLETWATMNAQPQRQKPVKDPRTLPDQYGFTPLQLAQNLVGAAARRHRNTGGGDPSEAAQHQELLRLLEPLTRIDPPQRDEQDFGQRRQLYRDLSMHRSTPTHERTSDGGSVRSGGVGMAPEPARLSFDSGTKGAAEGGSPGKAAGGEVEEGEAGQSLSAEVRARQRAAEAEAEEAANNAADAEAAAERAAAERAAAAEKAGLPPPKYVCPITLSVMDDPVTACDGVDYERSALDMWFELGNEEFPGSCVKIATKDVVPNNALKAEIAKWRAFKL